MKPYLLATLGGGDAARCGAVRCAAFSPGDTNRLATGGEDRAVRLWDSRSGACVAVLGGHEARVNACVFSPDGAYLVSGSNDGSLRLWDVGSGVCALVLTGHGDAVNSCDFSPDGALLASCSDDNSCKARCSEFRPAAASVASLAGCRAAQGTVRRPVPPRPRARSRTVSLTDGLCTPGVGCSRWRGAGDARGPQRARGGLLLQP